MIISNKRSWKASPFPIELKWLHLIFSQKAHNSNIFESSAVHNVESSNWDCRQSTVSVNMKPTQVTAPQLGSFLGVAYYLPFFNTWGAKSKKTSPAMWAYLGIIKTSEPHGKLSSPPLVGAERERSLKSLSFSRASASFSGRANREKFLAVTLALFVLAFIVTLGILMIQQHDFQTHMSHHGDTER